MKKSAADERIVEIGVVSLGKYTFPKMPALDVNVPAVLVRQEAKKLQMVLLPI
jgi:hypothetical protein